MHEVYDPEYAIKVNDQCDRLGLDTISFGVTVAFARECYQKGLLEKDISSRLEFGDADGLIELTKQVARREGFGNEFAKGSFRRAASLADEAEQHLYGCIVL